MPLKSLKFDSPSGAEYLTSSQQLSIDIDCMSPNWQNWDPDYISGSPQRKLHSQADLANEAWKQSRFLKKVDEIPDVWISGTGLL